MKIASDSIEQFLNAWTDKNYTKMYDLCQLTWKTEHSKKDLKKLIHVKIKSFKILETKQTLENIKDVVVSVQAGGNSRLITCRIIRESEPFKTSSSGDWGINPISVIRGLYA